ncbi:hypothetical protein CB1_000880053 [Camelus ferus]|nr:hypothetical protein CB1_000880053 [Camelus ferus]
MGSEPSGNLHAPSALQVRGVFFIPQRFAFVTRSRLSDHGILRVFETGQGQPSDERGIHFDSHTRDPTLRRGAQTASALSGAPALGGDTDEACSFFLRDVTYFLTSPVSKRCCILSPHWKSPSTLHGPRGNEAGRIGLTLLCFPLQPFPRHRVSTPGFPKSPPSTERSADPQEGTAASFNSITTKSSWDWKLNTEQQLLSGPRQSQDLLHVNAEFTELTRYHEPAVV